MREVFSFAVEAVGRKNAGEMISPAPPRDCGGVAAGALRLSGGLGGKVRVMVGVCVRPGWAGGRFSGGEDGLWRRWLKWDVSRLRHHLGARNEQQNLSGLF